MSVPNFVQSHPVDVDIFHWISDNLDLLMARGETGLIF